jgi:hypothetical protein
MATQWQTFPIQFGGGLISNLSPLQHGMTAIGSASILQNFEPTLDGGYKKVLGYQKLADVAVTGTGVVQGIAVIPESGSQKAIAVRNGIYYEINANDATPAWTSLGTAPDTNISKVRKTNYNFTGTEKIVFVDGVNYPAYYDVSAGTLTYLTGSGTGNTAVEDASFVTLYKSTLFFAVGTELVFTAPYTDTDFDPASGAGSINVASPITGMAVYRESLIVFCTDKIVRITGSTSADFTLTPITDDIGCLEPDTIQEVGGDVMFLAPDGVRTLSSTERIGDFGLDVTSKNIRPTLNKQRATATGFTSYVIREKAQYRLFSYSSTERASVAKGVLATKFIDQGGQGFQWAELKGYKVYVADSVLVDDNEIIYTANEDGYVYRHEVGTNRDTANIDAIFESAYMPINDPQVRKTFYKLDLYLKPEGSFNCSASIKLDRNDANTIQPAAFTITGTGGGAVYGSTESIFGTSLYSSPGDETYKNNLIGSGRTVALRIEDNSTNASFTLDTAILEFTTEDRQ